MESVKVIPQGKPAIVAYKETLVGTEHGKPFNWHIYTRSHWGRRAGKWLMTMFQDSVAKDTQAPSGESDDAVLNAILSSEKQIVGALSRDDIESFGRLLPDDIVDIWTDGVHLKPEWLRIMEQQKKDGYLFRDFRFEDPKLVRLGPDQAILTAREIIHGLNKGKPFEDRLYTMACYLRRNGKWIPLVYQDTPIQ